jgi:hypothetical protein
MPKNLEDTKAFESQWKNRGRDVRILDFSPDVILAQLVGPFSANELRNIASFLEECGPEPSVFDQKGVYIDE